MAAESRTIALILGAMLYFIGAALSNIYIAPVHTAFFAHPALELAALALGIFFLSSFFWGKFSYALLLFAGIWIGGLFPLYQIYVTFAVLPLLVALHGGTSMGENDELDIRGKGNLFEGKEWYISSALIAIALSAAIGYFAPGIQFQSAFGAAKAFLGPFGIE